MKFDTVIIGGGLAGLLCGIRLSENGQRCAIVSRGQSALNFSSGSLDLLSRLPDGQPVTDLIAGVDALQRMQSEHPYALLGAERVRHYAKMTQTMLADCGLALKGEADTPHMRVTPLGTFRQAWLSPNEIPLQPTKDIAIGVVGICGFLDFQPQLAAASLKNVA
jgi:glycerol-3-phosphate dehydrogenase subunit B